MKLIKTEKQFTNPFIEGALDIYADIENGNECGEDNALIILKRACEYLDLNYKTIAQAVNNNAIMKDQKVSEISDTFGGAQKIDFITWDCFGYIIANYLTKNANAKAIFDTWKHYSWVADIEKEIVGQAETFRRKAEECKARGDRVGYYQFMADAEREEEWEAKLKAEKERADKAEETIKEMEDRDVKTIINDLNKKYEPKKIHKLSYSLLREHKVWDRMEINKAYSELFETYNNQNGIRSIAYKSEKREEVKKLIDDWITLHFAKEEIKKMILFDKES